MAWLDSQWSHGELLTMDWKQTLAAVAPGLATALGGPLAGVAVSAISNKLLGKPDGTEDDIAAAVMSGSPDALLRLKEAEQQFQKDMKALDIDLERIHQIDRASARSREANTGDSITPRVLAGVIVVGFFSVLIIAMTLGLPEKGADAMLILIGALGAAFTAIVAYYFGSSAGSAMKTKLMSDKAS